MLFISKNPHREVRGHLDVTFTDKIFELAEAQAIHMAGMIDWPLKKSENMFKQTKLGANHEWMLVWMMVLLDIG